MTNQDAYKNLLDGVETLKESVRKLTEVGLDQHQVRQFIKRLSEDASRIAVEIEDVNKKIDYIQVVLRDHLIQRSVDLPRPPETGKPN